MLIAAPSRHLIKPAGDPSVDWGHPLARKLVFGCLFHPSKDGKQTDIVMGHRASYAMGSKIWTGAPGHPEWAEGNRGGAYWESQPSFQHLANSAFSWLIACCYRAAPTGGYLLDNAFSPNIEHSSGRPRARLASSGAYHQLYLGAAAPTAGLAAMYVLTFTGSPGSGQFLGYVNGRLDYEPVQDGSGDTSTSSRVSIGNQYYDYGEWPATVHFAYKWNRVLRPDEVRWLYLEPFGFLEARRRLTISIPAVAYTYTPSGGVALAGTASLARAIVVPVSGGVALSGSAATARTRAVQSTGGVAFSGTASVSRTRAVTGSGSVVLAGTAALARTIVTQVAGGLTLSGSAATARTRAVQPTGGVVFSGTAAVSRTRAVTGSGGVALSGTAALARAIMAPVSGGVALSGSAACALQTASSYVYVATGGFAFCGTAPISLVHAWAPNGGLTVSGTAALARTIVAPVSGGVTLFGSAAVARMRAVRPTGGVVFSGTASVSRTRTVTGSGSVVLAGTAGLARTIVAPVSGGVALSGMAAIVRTMVATGSGIFTLAGSSPVARTLAYVSTGLVELGGRAICEFTSHIAMLHLLPAVAGGPIKMRYIDCGQRLLPVRKSDAVALEVYSGIPRHLIECDARIRRFRSIEVKQ